MPEWLWVILVGVVSLGLVKLVYGIKNQEVSELKKWKETYPTKEEILTRTIHTGICKDNMKEIKDILIDNRDILIKHVESLKEHLDLKLERDILLELQKLNGKK